ncbi:sulfatase-like hydrolase/transferase [Solimonas marina]|uniref:Sulfatase-like hydrolase/transferase n=1 Tax=Solimonas marina TaxID=2714601 RepID=A0A970B757_9GAMM|nr:sulfatase-like hydrolase/transferase [Solimonas marina]NKF23528.1 sulfatase-like hydrolase/transferase [Solimonas marina]
MRFTLKFGAVLLLCVIVAGVVVAIFPMQASLLFVRLTKAHVEPNHAVAWEQGPKEAAPNVADRRPNVIVVLADDLGYNGISLHDRGLADGTVKTPNIDAIAEQGVEFLNGYAGNATCAPSRASILTGQYATRFGFEFTPTPAIYGKLIKKLGAGKKTTELHPVIVDDAALKKLPPMDDEAMPRDEVTVADVMRDAGYHTIQIGKWHLGGAPGARPEDKGFDEALGFIPGASMYLKEDDPDAVNAMVSFSPTEKYLWAGASWSVQYNGSPRFAPTRYMTDYLTDEAINAIHANRNRPFFMYFAPNAVHAPLQATREDYDALPQIKDHTLRVHAAMTVNLDRNVGRLMAELKKEGLDDNTIVIFTSDNGGTHVIGLPDINKPYRGWKATFFEGGLHVPFFMRWPGHIKPGSQFAPPVAHVDIAAIAAAAAGTQLPPNRVNDGVDILPYLTGEKSGTPHHNLFWRSGGDAVLIQDGWKLQRTERPKKDWLYDLDTDPTERHNLADAQPQRLAQMTAILESISRQQAKPLWPSTFAVPVSIDQPLGVPMKPGDAYAYWYN